MKELEVTPDGHIEGTGKRIRPAEFFDDAERVARGRRRTVVVAECISVNDFKRWAHDYDKDGRCIIPYCGAKAQCVVGDKYDPSWTEKHTGGKVCTRCGARKVKGDDGVWRYRWQ